MNADRPDRRQQRPPEPVTAGAKRGTTDGTGKSTQKIISAAPDREPVQHPSHDERESLATLAVPKSLHQELKAAAARAGKKLYQFIEPALRELIHH